MTTREIAEKQALEHLNGQLTQARANDPYRKPAPSVSVASFVKEAKEITLKTTPSLYPIKAEINAWQRQPETFTDELHERECSGGWLHDGETSYPCPRCAGVKRQAALRRQLVDSGVDGRYLDTTWADLQLVAPLDRIEKACHNIKEIIRTGASLLLWSEETGSGKTQAAMLAATAAVQAGHTAHVANMARLAVEIRDGYKPADGEQPLTEKRALQRLVSPDLLVLDDLGAGESDQAKIERRLLFLALDERQTKRLTTIVTTNLKPDQLSAVFGARIFARLQPLTIVHVNHKRNFRIDSAAVSLW